MLLTISGDHDHDHELDEFGAYMACLQNASALEEICAGYSSARYYIGTDLGEEIPVRPARVCSIAQHDESTPALSGVRFRFWIGPDVGLPAEPDLNEFQPPLPAPVTMVGHARVVALPNPTWD